METKEKKIFKHPFYDKHTILGTFALTALGMLFSQAVIGTIAGFAYSFITGDHDHHGLGFTIATYLGSIIGAFIILAIFKRWFYPEYEGGFKEGQNVPRWCIISFAVPAAILIYFFISGQKVGMPPLVNWFAALAAGVGEEAVFRGLNASYLMRQWNESKKIPQVILVSSLIFGLIHLSNLTAGAPLAMTALQVVSATCLGCFFCAIYLCSGSLIPGMIFHFLYDVVAFTDTARIGEGGAFKPNAVTTVKDIVFEIVLDVIYISATIYLTRPAAREQISDLWNKKWNKNAEETA